MWGARVVKGWGASEVKKLVARVRLESVVLEKG